MYMRSTHLKQREMHRERKKEITLRGFWCARRATTTTRDLRVGSKLPPAGEAEKSAPAIRRAQFSRDACLTEINIL
jgi:hypothetical protein